MMGKWAAAWIEWASETNLGSFWSSCSVTDLLNMRPADSHIATLSVRQHYLVHGWISIGNLLLKHVPRTLESIHVQFSFRTQSSFHYAVFSGTAAIHSSLSHFDSKWIPSSNVAFILGHNVFLHDVRFLQNCLNKDAHLNTLNRHTSTQTRASKCQSQLHVYRETKKQLRNRLKMAAAMNNAQARK